MKPFIVPEMTFKGHASLATAQLNRSYCISGQLTVSTCLSCIFSGIFNVVYLRVPEICIRDHLWSLKMAPCD